MYDLFLVFNVIFSGDLLRHLVAIISYNKTKSFDVISYDFIFLSHITDK